MRIYTRTGDTGETGLYGRGRVRKDDPRISACGGVDELNAAIGLALASGCSEGPAEVLRRVQAELFTLGAELAAPPEQGADVPRVTAEMVSLLERDIDRFEETLEPLRNFILPAGALPACAIHLARAVCRRAEREVVSLAAEEPPGPELLAYLNRLSDLLFVLARVENRERDCPETIWSRDAG